MSASRQSLREGAISSGVTLAKLPEQLTLTDPQEVRRGTLKPPGETPQVEGMAWDQACGLQECWGLPKRKMNWQRDIRAGLLGKQQAY